MTVAVSASVTGGPLGGSPVTVATLLNWPSATSALVVTLTAWHVIDWPGASAVSGQLTCPSRLSVSVTPCSVTLPVLTTVY
ncbi:MAG TPA: hypothetical protein VGM12_12180, partial [Trebonia sp.]